jgi:parallel beta-helix repeat protein
MKFIKEIVIIITMVLIFLPTISSDIGYCETLYVGENNRFLTIQDAFNASNENDIIYVLRGNYSENIKINKSINLIGEDKNKTIINGAGSIYIISSLSNDVTISGFTLHNSKIAIYVRGDNNTIKNNIIANTSNGIYLENSSKNNIISNNTLQNNFEGINFYNSSENQIIKNHIEHQKAFGVSLWENSNYNIILNNTFIDDCKAVSLSRWCNNNSIIGNNMTRNSWGIYLDYSFYNFIFENLIYKGSGGINLFNSNFNNVSNNSFEYNNQGIYLTNSDENDMFDNIFIENKADIRKSSEPALFVVFIPVILLLLFIMYNWKRTKTK